MTALYYKVHTQWGKASTIPNTENRDHKFIPEFQTFLIPFHSIVYTVQ